MSRLLSFVLLGLCAVLASCASPPDPAAPIDLRGQMPAARYVGTLPCADCAGVRTDLALYRQDRTPLGYALAETYLGTREGDRRFERTGRWSLQPSGQPDLALLTLDPGLPERERHFAQVGELVLRALDRTRNELPAHLPRSLVRVPDDVPADVPVLTAGDSRSLTDLAVGGQLVLLLPANRAMGYGWRMVPDPNAVLEPVANPAYVSDPASAARVAAPGLEVFRFRAPVPGQQILRLEYRRSWDPSTAQTPSVTFTVRVR
jgi:copper homeostasis protein (lipoprotein)